jgi:hypothetical protein
MHKEQVEAIADSILQQRLDKFENIEFLRATIVKLNLDFTESRYAKYIPLDKNFNIEDYRNHLRKQSIFEALYIHTGHLTMMVKDQGETITKLAKLVDKMGAFIEKQEQRLKDLEG